MSIQPTVVVATENTEPDVVENERRSARVKQDVHHFALPTAPKKETKIESGKGELLGKIPNICTLLNLKRADDPIVIACHKLCYGRDGKKTTRKSSIRAFSGLTACDEAQITQKLKHMSKAQKNLKEVAVLFDCLPESKSLDDIIAAIAKFLLKPQASGKELQKKRKSSHKKPKKQSKKKSKKAKKAKKDGPKRPMSSFLFFLNDKRASYQKKHPDFKATEVMVKLSKKWKELSADEKKPFEKLAAQAKEKYLEKCKEQKKPKKDKKDSKNDKSDSESSSDEELHKKKEKKRKHSTSDSSDSESSSSSEDEAAKKAKKEAKKKRKEEKKARKEKKRHESSKKEHKHKDEKHKKVESAEKKDDTKVVA